MKANSMNANAANADRCHCRRRDRLAPGTLVVRPCVSPERAAAPPLVSLCFVPLLGEPRLASGSARGAAATAPATVNVDGERADRAASARRSDRGAIPPRSLTDDGAEARRNQGGFKH